MDFDFALGEAADTVRETTHRFSADRIAPMAARIDAWRLRRAHCGFTRAPMRHLLPLVLLLGGTSAPLPPEPPVVRVRIETTAGAITLALDARHAPKTVANFMNYVDDGRLDGTFFYRAARQKTAPTQGFVQGGIGTDALRILDPFPLEPTSETGIRHTTGAVSMARTDRTDSANGNFSILLNPIPSMDARPGYPGYAAFGHVVSGMDVVKRILAAPTGPGGDGPMKGQMIVHPIAIVHAVRLDGVAHPTGKVRPWLLGIKR